MINNLFENLKHGFSQADYFSFQSADEDSELLTPRELTALRTISNTIVTGGPDISSFKRTKQNYIFAKLMGTHCMHGKVKSWAFLTLGVWISHILINEALMYVTGHHGVSRFTWLIREKAL
jgi:hypothetical protein